LTYYVAGFQPDVRYLFWNYIVSKAKRLLRGDAQTGLVQAWSDLSDKERNEKAASRKIKQFSGENSSRELTTRLEEIIALCNEYKIKLVGVKFPLSKEYFCLIGNSNYGADKILKSHNVPILNYKELFMKEPKCFADQDYLSDLGGKKLTEEMFK
jgi:hypothetical protein